MGNWRDPQVGLWLGTPVSGVSLAGRLGQEGGSGGTPQPRAEVTFQHQPAALLVAGRVA